ncbi:hypothetical protein GCM10027567_33070 [Spongiibacter taiwanensis]
MEDLAIFRCVAQEGGVLRAAERLNRVPSNVSTRIKQFEKRLGTPLFRRQGRNIVLTASGSNLFGHAERLLRMADEVEQELIHGSVRGALKLGSLESAASVRLPSILAAFHNKFPETQVELRTGTTASLLDQVESVELDAAFVSQPFEIRGGLSSMAAFQEELTLITSKEVPDVREVGQLNGLSAVAFPHGCSYRRVLVDWFATSGASPSRFLDLSSYHAIVACVAAGAGVAVVPASVLDSVAGSGAVKRHVLPWEIRDNTTHLVWAGELSPPLKNMMTFLPKLLK